MGLVLSWDIPFEVEPSASMSVYRTMPETPVAQLVARGGSWGQLEDPTNDDVDAVYGIVYRTPNGDVHVADDEIRRWPRSMVSCRVLFAFARPDGAPWLGRRIWLSDDLHAWTKELWTDHAGQAAIVLTHGTTLTIKLEGMRDELECYIPPVRDLNWEDLPAYGSFVRAERRSIM